MPDIFEVILIKVLIKDNNIYLLQQTLNSNHSNKDI